MGRSGGHDVQNCLYVFSASIKLLRLWKPLQQIHLQTSTARIVKKEVFNSPEHLQLGMDPFQCVPCLVTVSQKPQRSLTIPAACHLKLQLSMIRYQDSRLPRHRVDKHPFELQQ